jgi:hypothetical protein
LLAKLFEPAWPLCALWPGDREQARSYALGNPSSLAITAAARFFIGASLLAKLFEPVLAAVRALAR